MGQPLPQLLTAMGRKAPPTRDEGPGWLSGQLPNGHATLVAWTMVLWPGTPRHVPGGPKQPPQAAAARGEGSFCRAGSPDTLPELWQPLG